MDTDEKYIHYQECITSFNRAWSVACELESSGENNILRNAAYRMALIEYCKPYKKSNGNGKNRHALPLPSLTQDEESLHKNIIRLRDTVLAHSDINVKEAKVYLGKSKGVILPLIASNIETQWPSASELRRLIEVTLDQLYSKQSEYESELKQMGSEHVSF